MTQPTNREQEKASEAETDWAELERRVAATPEVELVEVGDRWMVTTRVEGHENIALVTQNGQTWRVVCPCGFQSRDLTQKAAAELLVKHKRGVRPSESGSSR